MHGDAALIKGESPHLEEATPEGLAGDMEDVTSTLLLMMKRPARRIERYVAMNMKSVRAFGIMDASQGI